MAKADYFVKIECPNCGNKIAEVSTSLNVHRDTICTRCKRKLHIDWDYKTQYVSVKYR